MPQYSTSDIRNIALMGHGGAGKTSVAEAMLFKAGATRRLGSVNEKTSHLDFSEDEKEKGCSLDSAVCYLDYQGKHVNIIDTPGELGFAGPAIAAKATKASPLRNLQHARSCHSSASVTIPSRVEPASRAAAMALTTVPYGASRSARRNTSFEPRASNKASSLLRSSPRGTSLRPR